MSEKDVAAASRAEYVRALREERDGYERLNRPERVAEVDAEIARVEGRPVGRSESPVEPAPRRRSK